MRVKTYIGASTVVTLGAFKSLQAKLQSGDSARKGMDATRACTFKVFFQAARSGTIKERRPFTQNKRSATHEYHITSNMTTKNQERSVTSMTVAPSCYSNDSSSEQSKTQRDPRFTKDQQNKTARPLGEYILKHDIFKNKYLHNFQFVFVFHWLTTLLLFRHLCTSLGHQ